MEICTLPRLAGRKFLKLIPSKYNYAKRKDKKFESIFWNYSIAFIRQGKILLEIPIPTKQVTSVTFGGPNLDILYVTTASVQASAEALGMRPNDKHDEFAGHLFKVTGLGAKGFPGVRVHVWYWFLHVMETIEEIKLIHLDLKLTKYCVISEVPK